MQVWFNLAWFDPILKKSIPALKMTIAKARNFNEEDKYKVLDAQIEVLKKPFRSIKSIKTADRLR